MLNGKPIPDEDFLEKIKKIIDQSLRISVLVRLYMRDLKSLLELYNQNITDLWNAVGRYNAKKAVRLPFDEQAKEAKEAQDTYKKSLSEVLEKMEKLVE